MLIILIPVFPHLKLDEIHCQKGLETWIYVLLVFYMMNTILSLMKYLLARFWRNQVLSTFVAYMVVSLFFLLGITQLVISMNMSFGI